LGDAVSIWIHLLAVTLWIGPQVFLFAAAVPALRTIEDVQQRARVLRVLVERFGWIGWSAMTVIVLTGITNLLVVAGDLPGYNAADLLDSDLRFTRVFWEKMFLVAVALALTFVHTVFVGPRQLQLMEDTSADESEIRRVRRLSMITSGLALLASVLALYMGAVLAQHDYSLVPD
jgi:uncharacterized membrane protein